MTSTLEQAFDIATSPIPSFGALQALRADIWADRHGLDSFRRRVAQLGTTGEEGRRRGLGEWIAGEHARAAELLAPHTQDHVAAFTLARTFLTIGKPAQALPLFEQLSKAYPDEPKPRGGSLEAKLEIDIAASGPEAASEKLNKAIAAAPQAFRDSAEGHYLAGRAHELVHDYAAAFECYILAREQDPTLRANLFRLGYCAERTGRDDEALEAYWTLSRMLPADKAVLLNLGVLLEDLGRDQDAAACYDTIAQHDATDRRARLYLADAVSGIDMYYDEDMERKEDRLNQILRTPITDFELSVRARNCLNKMNILVLGDLVRLTEQELLSYKNFGETSLNEIKEILAGKGLRLGMARDEAVRSIEAVRRRGSAADPGDVLNKAIGELELSIRARRTVEMVGCLTVGDIVQHSEDELMGMPNFGATSMAELKQKLAELGLKLRTKE